MVSIAGYDYTFMLGEKVDRFFGSAIWRVLVWSDEFGGGFLLVLSQL